VDCGYNIHVKLGPGLLESVYEALLAAKLTAAGLRVERQKAVVTDFESRVTETNIGAEVVVNQLDARFCGSASDV
jgi:GxxExxY protein